MYWEECRNCQHINNLEFCQTCVKRKKRLRKGCEMDINLNVREKKKAGELESGQTFRTIEKVACYEVVDLSKVDMFESKSKVVLRSDVIYCVELSTGVVSVFPKTLDVYLVNLRAEEI